MENEIQKKRCAIYTRKSVEEGLEMEFNSLDAQREACEAYIVSQKPNGWVCLPKHYDDGGVSGGTLDRPALKELLADAKNGKIDIIVIYKLDRLSRSICDFAELSKMFDEWGVSFVSVTQEINTSTSAGRMMLNILITFAQYEREVIAERIRDKMSASRKRGQWVGGAVPFGYIRENRRIVPDPEKAQIVVKMFDLFLKDRSSRAVAFRLNKKGIRNGRGNEWKPSGVIKILNNLPHADTPLGRGIELTDAYAAAQLKLGLKMIAVTRLYLHDVNIAATTALQALDNRGREQGILAGANVLMPNVTDTEYRRSYQLYENKPCLDENSAKCRNCLNWRVLAIGETINWGHRGDFLHFTGKP